MKADNLISEYAHLKSFPREAEALLMLKKIASLVRPIMRQRGFRVGLLQEFWPPPAPDGHHLLGRSLEPPVAFPVNAPNMFDQ